MNAARRAVGRGALAAIAGVLLTACETAPTRPSVMVLPGTEKSIEQFQVDDGACRQWAVQQTGSETGAAAPGGLSVQGRYDIAYMQCMFAKGHRIPVRRGSPPPATSPPSPAVAPNAPTPPDVPPPAGTPPPPPPGSARPGPASA